MKFSDALRGAADRAPVDELQVSTNAITGRIKRERALRMGANGLVGAGAVAVIAFAAMGPLSSPATDMAAADSAGSNEAPMAEQASPGDEAGMAMDGAMDGMSESLARADSPWMCGSDFDPADGTWAWGDASGVTYTVDVPEHDGADVLLPNTLAAHRTVDVVSSADYVVTWDGMVVGYNVNPETLEYGPDTGTFLPDLPEGQIYERLEPGTDLETLEQWSILTPVNCWDGAALPAGDYEVHQAWTLAYAGEDSEPAAEDGEPGDGPAVTSEMPMLLEAFRVAADPVTLSIDGEPVDDPFGPYLNGDIPVTPLPEPLPIEPLPEGSLTPDAARELFDAHAVAGTWDMAAGSQRWVITHDSTVPFDDEDWQANYFGCTWDDGANPGFPTRSAELDLLDVDVKLPARIGVSYGFVVDDNPKVEAKITNVSDFTLPGYWGDAQPQLMLVQDGKVVASASPQGVGVWDPASATTSTLRTEDFLKPGASVDGTYLLRDVHRCDSSANTNAVAPGTYTVLAAYSVSVSKHQLGGPQTMDESSMDHTFDTPTPDIQIQPAPDMRILPAPEDWDSLELQSWTSLGTITVS